MSHSPIFYRFLYLLTPVSQLPSLPQAVKSYAAVNFYTIVQVITTLLIFIVTLTQGAPAFPILIIALIPIRLTLMKKVWHRETLRFVDAWACREGTPEDEEDSSAHGGESGNVAGEEFEMVALEEGQSATL